MSARVIALLNYFYTCGCFSMLGSSTKSQTLFKRKEKNTGRLNHTMNGSCCLLTCFYFQKQRATLRDKEVEDKASQIKNWMHKKISEVLMNKGYD